jgi:hypothetical protein
MQPFQWSKLPRVNDVHRELDAQDLDCLKEVADVLRRHGKEWRFGVNLLHSHFELKEDQVLIETSDPEDQSLWIRPISIAAVAGEDVTETTWCLATGEPTMGCVCKRFGGDHRHQHMRGPVEAATGQVSEAG